MVYLMITSLIQIYLYYVFEFTVLVPFHRLFFFYLIGMSLLTGYGTICLFNYGAKKHIKKQITIAIIIILLISQIYIIYQNPLPKNPKSYLNDELYDVLKYSENNYPGKAIIIADSVNSISVYPVSGKKVFGIVEGNIGGGYHDDLNKYLGGNCEVKKITLNKYLNNTKNITILSLSEKGEICNFLKFIYSNDKYYVYESDLMD